jgi:hypothetical protein
MACSAAPPKHLDQYIISGNFLHFRLRPPFLDFVQIARGADLPYHDFQIFSNAFFKQPKVGREILIDHRLASYFSATLDYSKYCELLSCLSYHHPIAFSIFACSCGSLPATGQLVPLLQARFGVKFPTFSAALALYEEALSRLWIYNSCVCVDAVIIGLKCLVRIACGTACPFLAVIGNIAIA